MADSHGQFVLFTTSDPPRNDPPSSKRRRIALSCKNCRERGMQCDKNEPVCGACQDIFGNDAQPCEYQRELGQCAKCRQRKVRCDGNKPVCGACVRRGDECDYQPIFFQLLRNSRAPVGQQSEGAERPNPQGDRISSQSVHSDDSSLVPRGLADRLLRVYFDNVYAFYPWVHKRSFMTAFNLLWTSQSTGNALTDLPDIGLGSRNCSPTLFQCAMNAMFALADEFTDMQPGLKKKSSEVFYNCMKSLLDIDVFDGGSLAHVQALLIAAQYLQCTPDPKKCWNAVGMAYRMAVGLGLHLSNRPTSDLGPVEREMQWRTWCACVHMDITVSMIMGHSPMTPSHEIPLPSRPTNEQLKQMDEQENTESAAIVEASQFFYENMRLTEILAKILTKIYQSANPQPLDPPQTPVLDMPAILEIERDLEGFKETLHPAFHWKTNDYPSKRRISVLHARFLHLKLLLYRPAFSEYFLTLKSRARKVEEEYAGLAGPGAGSWDILFLENCATRCVHAACNLSWQVNWPAREDAWWYGAFYIFTAGIILVIADMSNTPFYAADGEYRAHAWDKCIDKLLDMGKVHSSARDYELALSTFRMRHVTRLTQDSNRSLLGERRIRTQSGNQLLDGRDYSHDRAHSPDEDEDDGGIDYTLCPLLSKWGSELGDIMLPVRLLQERDDELLMPCLF